MKDTWRQLFRRLAAGCIIGGSVSWSSAMCYAVTLANDTASDPVYASSWENGQNGGTGFTAWNFESGYFWPYFKGGNNHFYPYDERIHTIDNGLKAGSQFSNPFNNIGRSWTGAIIQYAYDDLGNPKLTLPRGGRGLNTATFPSGLQIGQTFSVTIDNPTERKYYKGFSISLNGNTGGVHGNICYGNRPCYYVDDPAHPGQQMPGAAPKEELKVQIFNFSNCPSGNCLPTDPRAVWHLNQGNVNSTVTDIDSAAGGMKVDITRTNSTDFSLTLTPLANPSAAFTTTGTFANPGYDIDWFQFETFNGIVSDTGGPAPGGDFNTDGKVDAADYAKWRKDVLPLAEYNTWRANFGSSGGAPTTATDFYIRSMSITGPGSGVGSGAVPEPGTFVYIVAIATGGLGLVGRRRQ